MLTVADMASNNEEDYNMLTKFIIDMRKKLKQKESKGGLGRKVNISSTTSLSRGVAEPSHLRTAWALLEKSSSLAQLDLSQARAQVAQLPFRAEP